MDVKKKTGVVVGALVGALLVAGGASAADMLMLIPDVPGNSRILPDGIDVTGFSHGVSVATDLAGGAGAGTGKPNFSNLMVSKSIDKATPMLYHGCATGKLFPEVQLFVRQSGGDFPSYYIYKLKDVMISSCKSSGDSSSKGLGQEEITFDYRAIETDYLGLGGPTSFAWDIQQMTM